MRQYNIGGLLYGESEFTAKLDIADCETAVPRVAASPAIECVMENWNYQSQTMQMLALWWLALLPASISTIRLSKKGRSMLRHFSRWRVLATWIVSLFS